MIGIPNANLYRKLLKQEIDSEKLNMVYNYD